MNALPLPSWFEKLLAFLERRLKTDVHYLLSGTFWGGVSQVASIASALALSIVISRYVPKDVYGEYKYILSIVSLLPILSLTGIGSAVLQSVSRGFDGALAEGFRANLRWSYAIFTGALALALYYFWQGNFTLGFGILLGGCISPFMTSATLATSFLLAKKDFVRNALLFGVLGSVGPAIALMATALLHGGTLALVSVYFVANLMTDLYLYWHTMRVYKPARAARDPHMHSYAKHLSVMGVVSSLAGNIDQVLIFHFIGPIELAVYNFATGIVDQTKGPLKNLDQMLQARFAGRDAKEIHGSAGSKFILLALTSIGIIILYSAVAPFIYQILFPAYTEAVPYSQLYALSLLGIVQGPIIAYFSAHKKIYEQYVNTVGSSLLQILFMAGGVIVWGLLGLIAGRVLASLMTTLFTFGQYYRVRKSEFVQ
jgi:O-antigen/teichoic acid export membrane protein